jgi:hypothetical protein
VTTKVHGILLFIPIPFNGVPRDACANHNVDHCPIIAGETLLYTNAIYVNPIYPLVSCIFCFNLYSELPLYNGVPASASNIYDTNKYVLYTNILSVL